MQMKAIRKKEGFDGQRAIVLPRKVIAVQCSENPLIDEAYITDIGYYPKAVNHYRKRSHGIDQNILIHCVEGKGWLEVRNVKQQVGPGNFFLVPAGLAHAYAADEAHPWTIYWIHFKGGRADLICNSIINRFRSHVGVVMYSERRAALFEEIYSSLERGYSSEHILYANMCLSHFLASFYFDKKFGYSNAERSPDPSSRAIDYMQDNIGRNLKLKNIAEQVNLSVSHFAGTFQKTTGFSPIEYFNHLKIQKACQFLQFTDDPIKEISSGLGIDDSYYFSRLFKKLMGLSPAGYRKRFKNER